MEGCFYFLPLPLATASTWLQSACAPVVVVVNVVVCGRTQSRDMHNVRQSGLLFTSHTLHTQTHSTHKKRAAQIHHNTIDPPIPFQHKTNQTDIKAATAMPWQRTTHTLRTRPLVEVREANHTALSTHTHTPITRQNIPPNKRYTEKRQLHENNAPVPSSKCANRTSPPFTTSAPPVRVFVCVCVLMS